MASVVNTGGSILAIRIVIGHCLSARNRRTGSGESSVEIHTNAMFFPFSRGFAARRAMEGISPTQGGHHVAQMFRNTVFPLKPENGAGLPFRSSSVQS